MRPMSLASDPEPPLPNRKVKVLASILFIFFTVLIRRVFFYCLGAVWGVCLVWGAVSQRGYTLKKFGLRLLMYRGGYFHQTHRLGLTAVTATTVFSAFLIPLANPVQEYNTLSIILSESQNVQGESDALVLESNGLATLGQDATNTKMQREVEQYVVEGGDTFSTIAEQFLVSVEALKYVNDLTSDIIRPGDVLTVPPVGGLIHEVEGGDTISSIATLYSVSPQALVDFNHLEEPFTIHSGDELVVPDAKVPQRAPTVLAYVSPSSSGLSLETIAPSQLGSGGFSMPTAGSLSQYFWWGHTAVDVAGGCGTPVTAADSGTITFAGWWPGGGGNSVFIDHGNGYVTKYAHLSGFERTGGGVSRGDIIGYAGATGRAYGCHLHFIVLQNGRPINPLSVL